MQLTSETLERAIEALARLPGIGRKSAQRVAMYLIKQSPEQVEALSESLLNLKRTIKHCSICFNITDEDPCRICTNEKRDTALVCVVEETKDVYAIERTNQYRGHYHVLGGVLSPLDRVGPADLRIRELIERVGRDNRIREVILALNPDAEGEATSYYIQKLLQPFELNVTRIAQGIPMGTELEFIDEATLGRALSGRAGFGV
jgi:recombination protein RecR